MALPVGDRAVRPLTAEEVMRTVAAGILADDEHVELLDGVLTRMGPRSPEHGAVVSRLLDWLWGGASAGAYAVRSEHPLIVPDVTSLPEPDVAVVALDQDPRRHPATAMLVVEVAVTSRRTDTSVKPVLYASAGVPELWVVDVPARCLLVFSEPGSDGYSARSAVTAPRLVTPRAVDVAPLDLGALLAGL